MNKFLRFLICYLVSFAALYLSGYGNLMGDIAESLAVTTFLGSALILAIFAFLLWEIYLGFKTKIAVLTKRIEELEQKSANDEK